MSDSLFRRALDAGIAARQTYGDADEAMFVIATGILAFVVAMGVFR